MRISYPSFASLNVWVYKLSREPAAKIALFCFVCGLGVFLLKMLTRKRRIQPPSISEWTFKTILSKIRRSEIPLDKAEDLEAFQASIKEKIKQSFSNRAELCLCLSTKFNQWMTGELYYDGFKDEIYKLIFLIAENFPNDIDLTTYVKDEFSDLKLMEQLRDHLEKQIIKITPSQIKWKEKFEPILGSLFSQHRKFLEQNKENDGVKTRCKGFEGFEKRLAAPFTFEHARGQKQNLSQISWNDNGDIERWRGYLHDAFTRCDSLKPEEVKFIVNFFKNVDTMTYFSPFYEALADGFKPGEQPSKNRMDISQALMSVIFIKDIFGKAFPHTGLRYNEKSDFFIMILFESWKSHALEEDKEAIIKIIYNNFRYYINNQEFTKYNDTKTDMDQALKLQIKGARDFLKQCVISLQKSYQGRLSLHPFIW